jgi:hypothetical protein
MWVPLHPRNLSLGHLAVEKVKLALFSTAEVRTEISINTGRLLQ